MLDGSGQFHHTRFLVNDACFFAKKTLISASMFRFEGQLTSIKPHAGFLLPLPLSRALGRSGPEPPEPVCWACWRHHGYSQASEAIEEILGIGETIADKLVIYDAWK